MIYDPSVDLPESFWLQYNGGVAPTYPIPAAKVFYVDSTKGNDANDGSLTAPLQTLYHAVVVSENNSPGSTIVVRAGLYRWTWNYIVRANTTIQNYPGEIPVILGTALSTQWAAEGSLWSTPWSWSQANFPDPSPNVITSLYPLASPRQIFLVELGKWTRLTPAGSITTVTSGTFFFDVATSKIYIGDDPNVANRSLEIAATPLALSVGANNFTLRGLIFKGFGSSYSLDPGRGAVSLNSNNNVIQDCGFFYSGNRGLNLFGLGSVSDIVKHNVFLFNGGGGISGYAIHKSTFIDNYFGYNNQQRFSYNGANGDAGNKVTSTDSLTVSGNTFDHELANSWWCDSQCTNFKFVRNIVRDSEQNGIFHEASNPGPGIIAGNIFSGNRGGGIALNSGQVRVYNNTLVHNGWAHIDSNAGSSEIQIVNNIMADLVDLGLGKNGPLIANDPASIIKNENNIIVPDGSNFSTLFTLDPYNLPIGSPAIGTGSPIPQDIALLLSVPASPTDVGYITSISSPTSLIATLQWQDNSNNEAGFKIERSVNGGPFIQIGQVLAGVTTFQDSMAAPGNCYRVRAFNSAGDSSYSNIACITILPPQAPGGLTVK